MNRLFTSHSEITIAARRERVFLMVASIFFGTLGIVNILGISRFVDLSFSIGDWTVPMLIPLGVLPYPITFLCTDIISEFYGKQRANLVVWLGLLVNLWILGILWFAGILPPNIPIDPSTQLPPVTHSDYAFFQIRLFTISSVFASMIAYLVAQLLDVHLFHFWKKLTRGNHLWLRNNGSTIVSQFVDTVIVVSFTYFFTKALPITSDKAILPQLMSLIFASYTFKVIAALIDTIPCYLIVYSLRRYFGLSKQTPTIEAPFSPYPANS